MWSRMKKLSRRESLAARAGSTGRAGSLKTPKLGTFRPNFKGLYSSPGFHTGSYGGAPVSLLHMRRAVEVDIIQNRRSTASIPNSSSKGQHTRAKVFHNVEQWEPVREAGHHRRHS